MAVVDSIIQTIEVGKLVLLYGWPFLILIWIAVLKYRWKNWPVEVEIIEKRGDNLIKTNDRAGKYVDPYTQITGYKLQKSGDTIPVVNYDWVMHNVFKPTTLFDRFVALIRGNIGTIFLFRYGSKQYKPIKIIENGKAKMQYQAMKNDKGEDIIINVYQQFDPRDKLGALDFEVVDWDNMNFMVQEQRASIERRRKKSDFLMQIAIPLAILAVTAVICIIMIKFGYDYAISMQGQNIASKPAEAPKTPIIGSLLPGS